MKRTVYCPACGNREPTNLFITTLKGKSLALHLSSQADIRKSSGEICCIVCKHVGHIDDFIKDRKS
jgi:hypothetical protein